MKLLRHGAPGREKPGLMDPMGNVRDLSDVVEDIDAHALAEGLIERLRDIDVAALPRIDGAPRIGPCIGGVGKIVCVGLNYIDHGAETGMALPREPVLFTKASSAITGPYDPIVIPRGAQKTDWEVELACVIGRTAKSVAAAAALDYVAGYCILNDVSERAFQLEKEGQWVKGKSCDTFAPIGPWLVTPEEVGDPQKLDLWLDVNGERRQTGNTAMMIFPLAHIIHYISRFMTLLPGDVVSTGTPPGVGMGMTPQTFLKAGDVVGLGVEGLGAQRQVCVDEARSSA
ncbi:fumarylacetoacetate hydrolase family protein [Varunaivibrio sulfuroxidans]|uniref:2-keto-4-pentenoate hydratase/2-oxohepta-3-ene-1,7-dioic acid hydratase in catechol pathway n=1 Tax=Varunaivibrio sulfuroxidans TaxID=1773489 RepID=A0A4R3JB07_9PROT|nr:fumarylacetoacetate hydrolase family protein [Varunaivibrio sulfuroxidans]TCS62525.1 2-keto-4-pentenoate hydratase/2-oxohepta-3-ene-1,7-dioic acid hydratase in catechol pathway [Varunaivibrio sulfuroxidans]WES30804.1 fumarylacetoacetate hydrolase family protein [Varunaivibrio sulfuroxidans]